MKVSDLLNDLEKGDRSMEHLKKGAEPDDQGLTFQRLQDVVNSFGSGLGDALGQHFSGGLGTGGLAVGLAGLNQGLAQQRAHNDLMNQYMADARVFMPSISNIIKGW